MEGTRSIQINFVTVIQKVWKNRSATIFFIIRSVITRYRYFPNFSRCLLFFKNFKKIIGLLHITVRSYVLKLKNFSP